MATCTLALTAPTACTRSPTPPSSALDQTNASNASRQRHTTPARSNGSSSARSPFSYALNHITAEPNVRVRIVKNADTVTFNAPGGVIIGPTAELADQIQAYRFTGPVTLTRTPDTFIIHDATQRRITWNLPGLTVHADAGQMLSIDGDPFPGVCTVHPWTDRYERATSKLDVINHVPLETYIAGVIEHELYSSWELETFRAQAIAARSYYFYEAWLNRDKPHDLENTQASQVYGGVAHNPKAIQAAESTRGLVLTYDNQVLPAFFSSTSGGIGADAIDLRDDMPDLAPLRGFDQGGWSQNAPRYRWAQRRSASDLAQRIAAYGASRTPNLPCAQLQGLTTIQVSGTNAAGRPNRFTLTDRTGNTFILTAEDFRRGANFSNAATGRLPSEQQLYSAHVTITTQGQDFIFQGRGFGHGVGMCQFSAEAMAEANHRGEAIVQFFYPGATLQRVY